MIDAPEWNRTIPIMWEDEGGCTVYGVGGGNPTQCLAIFQKNQLASQEYFRNGDSNDPASFFHICFSFILLILSLQLRE